MTSVSTQSEEELEPDDSEPDVVVVRVLLTIVEGADLAAAISTVRRQVFDPAPDLAVVGEVEDPPVDLMAYPTLEQAIVETDETVDYLWILHSDARPRPDALSALVRELELNDAALGGSKLLVAGSRDVLEEVGSATDVFGEPYSGLEQNEIDLQQYDVVREVAFVRSASMLVRRDLAQGLRGLDVKLPPVAAGLDFSQRTRLAGGSVISVPSSEVYHQGRCNEGVGGWREQAGRLRAMFTAYEPLTLAWVIPYDILVSIADSIANLLLLRWRPLARHVVSWLWNLANLLSTLRHRRRLNRVRVAGDEELFRFQARGSVRLRDVGTELSARALSLFDDDETLVKRSRVLLTSPGIWGAMMASAIALVAARSLLFGAMPSTGFAFPFEDFGVSLDRWFAGWNGAGLGSPAPVHPSVLTTGLLSLLTFGSTGAARTLFTISLAVIAIAGMGRLGSRLGLRGPGRYLSGLVVIAGPGTSLLAGSGSWLALAAAAFLPWAVRAVMLMTQPHEHFPWAAMGWAVLLGGVLATFSPLLLLLPLLMALVLPAEGRRVRRILMGLACLSSVVVAVPFLIGDPGWLTDTTRKLVLVPSETWTILLAGASLPLIALENPWRRIGLLGSVMALASGLLVRLPVGGAGVEEGFLVVASFGAALAASAGMDRLNFEFAPILAVAAAAAILIMSVGTLSNGRYGLPAGDVNEDLGFASVITGDDGSGRVLIASTLRSDIPGEARRGPGFWYRLLDGVGTSHGEVWLPPPSPGDTLLLETLEAITKGDVLHPGVLLAPFAVNWLVLEGPGFRLDEVLLNQVDFVSIPFDSEIRVFQNLIEAPIAASDLVTWEPRGAGFGGESSSTPVRLAVNHSAGWSPDSISADWSVTVNGAAGEAGFRGSWLMRVLSIMGGLVLLAGLTLIVIGRRPS